MRAGVWLGASAFLLAVCTSGVSGRDEAEKPGKLGPAPRGFDSRRKDVKRGKAEVVEYASKSSGGQRRMVVYTPPDYSTDRKYPVLYLLHGAGDDETGWTKKGSAAVIL